MRFGLICDFDLYRLKARLKLMQGFIPQPDNHENCGVLLNHSNDFITHLDSYISISDQMYYCNSESV